MRRLWIFALFFPMTVGCAGAVIEPGHRGLLFDPKNNGLKPEVLAPGYYSLESCFLRTVCQRIDDFDVTYSTKKEEIETQSIEGLGMGLKVAVIYRPIISELYELDTEIGPAYYDEVIGPEFRSAARGVIAHHSYKEMQKNNSAIEDEIENELRKRTKGKHVEIASVTLEQVQYSPEIVASIQGTLLSEQEAAKQKLALENQSVQMKLKAEAEVKAKEQEKKMAEEQAAIDKIQAEDLATTGIMKAKAEAEEEKYHAKAEMEMKKAEASSITPLVVQMHAYDALAALGGNGTTILLGDWSHVPNFLFPSAVFPGGMAPAKPTKPASSDGSKSKVVPASNDAGKSKVIPTSTNASTNASTKGTNVKIKSVDEMDDPYR